MNWHLAGRKGFYMKESALVTPNVFRARGYFQENGGLTKSLTSDGDAEYTMPLLVRATPDQWLGVAAIIGLDGGKTRDTKPYVAKWFPLRWAENLSEPTK
jgi:hypothetical protein